MPIIKIIRNKFILLLLFIITALPVFSQNTTAAEPAAPSHNWLITLLVLMIAIMAFVIWSLGTVLTGLSRQLMEKIRNSKTKAAVITVVLMLSSVYSQAQDMQAIVKTEPNFGGLSSTTFYMLVTVIVIEVFAVFFLLFAIKKIQGELMPQVKSETKTSSLKLWWSRIDNKYFTKAVPVAKEADVMLDHNYDGIHELDNALPPWWKYGFYITIVVGVVYLFNFHVFGNGKSPDQEYTAEQAAAKIQLEMYNAQNKDNIDEANVPMAGADGIAYAKGQFKEKCIACHGELAEGKPGLGPNLTDNYWIHKGALNDVYSSIKNGYPDKGMQSWSTVFTPKEISYLASYIKSLKGSNPPNAKAPQGDLFTDEPAADSGKSVKPDSVLKSGK
jgi:cytochrome c oxidase cbb3-type subunit 3